MKKIITFLILIISLNLFSQQDISIKGKLFFSDDFYKTFPNLLVKIDSSSEFIQIKEDGNFEIKTPIKKESYQLFFYYGNIKFKEFDYEFEWTKRKKAKSISLAEKCEVNKFIARNDYKKKKLKIFIFNENENEKLKKKDKRIQKRASFEYIKIPLNKMINYDCYLDYNEWVYTIFNHTTKRKYLDKLRKDVIGYFHRYSHR
ncbi:hypothetical protein JL193_15880 [Polaribacter batillariae]|uniref:DUF4369 domain-containing protein n=1 Tax=Polaribacter batillariae TaxID=2808900 RepID=A0ABX7STH2_9FLAO|nr:hypothetical protein [Polaribacter batillariae]QTD37535.1 hypothetical protein JL193_15880 [Polaribacter batillariae]